MGDNQILIGNTDNEGTEDLLTLKTITLEACFRSIIEGKPVEFDLRNLNNILNKDLQVNFLNLKPDLKAVIPYMLVHFINTWPGWQKCNNYLTKQISFDDWFGKFKEYLVFKINYMIKNDYEKAKTMLQRNLLIDENILFKIDNSTQMNVGLEKSMSPYTIEIHGTPKMLNSVIFCEGAQDSIVMREYRNNKTFEKLLMKQLVNWPHLEVEFISKELNFKRKNVHEYKRYLMLSNEKITFKKIESLIEDIQIIDEKIDRTAYTLNALREYCDTYVVVLKKHQKILCVSDEYVDDIKTIFDNFILDVKALNMNSMATNTSVLFNLGRDIYARNKSVRTSKHSVSFAESITPKVNLSLLNFTGLKDEKSDTPFQGLHDVLISTDKEFIVNFLPSLKYGCTFCNESYKTKVGLVEHLKENHCMEQPVLCFKCKSQMNILQICEDRWGHECKTNAEEAVVR